MKFEVKLEVDTSRTGAFLRRLQRSWKVRLAVLASLIVAPVVVYAVTRPYTFTDGSVISASQMNANFDALFQAVNLLEGSAPQATCKDILALSSSAPDGYYYIDPDGSGGLRAFQVWCDMSNGGWIRVDSTSHYPFAIHTEGEYSQPYTYALTTAQINAIKAKSTAGKQDWRCQTLGVGNQYRLTGWDNSSVYFAQCYDPGNTAYVSNSGTHTTFAQLPFKEWKSQDCGDATEACQHFVAPAFFR